MNATRPYATKPPVSRRALVLEDNFEIAQVLGMTLEDIGFEVVIAAHAEEALEVLEGMLPDVIVLDLLLGVGMDGQAFALRLREQGIEIPTVVVSVYSGAAAVAAGLGAQHLMKPFDLDDFVAMVQVTAHHN